MIEKEEIIKIGQFNKPHGIKGELSLTFGNDIFEEENFPFLICELDGILVPFRTESFRYKSNFTLLVKFKGIDSDIQAKQFTNKNAYLPKKYVQETSWEDYLGWDYFIGYTLCDERAGEVGEIIAIDETTMNVLFIVQKDGQEIFIPANEDMISGTDPKKKLVYLQLPDGLTDL